MTSFRNWFNRLKLSDTLILWGLAVGVGLATAMGVWLFKEIIQLTFMLEYGKLGSWLSTISKWTLFVLPVLGGLLVGAISHFFIGEERHSGVAGIMESVALTGGRLRYKRAPAKMVAAALSIGSGASVGPEDPSVQIGANLGSMVGQRLHFSDERMRALVAAGAASGISAAFNAPIAGVFFALEIILGEISGAAFGVVMLASVTSAILTQTISGTQPAFQIPPYVYSINWQLPLYLLLGLLAGPIAAVYIRLLFIIKDAFAYISQIPRWLKPAITGLLLGIIGLFLPQVLGIGYVTIGNILNGSITDVSLLLILMVAKLFLTPTSLAGGFIGGVFAPSLFIGATLGGAFGQISNIVFPALGINPATFAMVGMAAVLAGSVHAPLTAIILLFEMTNDYHIILPVMFAVVVSQVTSQRLVQDSVYTLSLRRKGIRLERGKDVEILQTILVQEVMQPAAFTLRDTDSLSHASEFFFKTHHHGAPVLNAQNELVGIFTLQDMDATDADQWSSVSIGEACTHDLIVAYPDETIGSALRKMAQRDVGRMPVVSPENPRTLLGLLRRTDVIRAYDAALTRKAAMRHRIHQLQLGALAPSDMHVEEFQVEQGTVCANKPVRDVAWPVDCLVASIRRKGQIVVPHGDTVIRPGDVLVLITESSCIDELSKIDNTPEEHNPG